MKLKCQYTDCVKTEEKHFNISNVNNCTCCVVNIVEFAGVPAIPVSMRVPGLTDHPTKQYMENDNLKKRYSGSQVHPD